MITATRALATRALKPKRSAAIVDMEQLARNAIAGHSHFRGRADGFEFEQNGDVLTVRGRVPSFYLKQVLQAALMRLDDMRVLNNQVEVVSCAALRSPPQRTTD